jgi:S1-C subfamily serine protease
VRDLDAAFVRRLDIPPSVHGVIVSRIDPAGAAFVPPIRRGFVIMEVNRRPIGSPADYARLMASMRPGQALAIYGYDPSIGERVLLSVTMDTR